MTTQEVFPEVSGDLAEKSFLVKTDRLTEMKVDNEVKPYITKKVNAPLDANLPPYKTLQTFSD